MNKLRLSFGIESYLRAFKLVLSEPSLKRWYRSTILKTAVLAFILLVFVLSIGIWLVNSQVQEFYSRILLIGLVAFAGLYFSSTISALLMNSLVMLIGGERAITDYFFPGSDSKSKLLLQERVGELASVFKSLAFGLVAVPFFMLPYTIPLGILIISRGMGGEAISTAQRIAHEFGVETRQDLGLVNWQAKIGVGIIPAMMGMIPIVGFFFLPVAVISALEVQITDRKANRAANPIQ